MTGTTKWLVPALIIAVGGGGGAYLARQDRAVKVTDQGMPVQPPAPRSPVRPGQWWMPGLGVGPLDPTPPGPVPAPTVETKGTPATAPGQPVQVPGGVIRSLDKINAAAARVGCPVLVPNDPAGKLLDVSECLGEKAVKFAPGQKRQ